MPHKLTGNSGFGITGRQKKVECPKADALEKEYRAALKVVYDNMSNDVGSVCHAMLDTYHSGLEDDGTFEDGEGNPVEVGDQTLEKATHILDWYRPSYARNAWGEVMETERLIDSREVDGLSEAIGFRDGLDRLEPYTCKIDLTTRMSREDVIRINEEEVHFREVSGRGKSRIVKISRPTLPGPGVYTADFKVYQAEHAFLPALFGPTNVQFTAYQLSHIHTYGVEDYRGLLALVIIKTKEPQLRVMHVPPPDEHSLAVFVAFQRNYNETMKRIENEGPYANNHQCFNWFRQCRHLGRGCERH